MAYKYSFDADPGRSAKALLRAAPISAKHAVEVCRDLRGRRLEVAMKRLEDVIALRAPIAFKRYRHDVPHRKGHMAAGRFPVKASKHILDLLKAVNASAQERGLSTADLVVTHLSPKMAARPYHPGRHVRRKMKRTNVEVVVTQAEAPKQTEKVARKRTERVKEPARPAKGETA